MMSSKKREIVGVSIHPYKVICSSFEQRDEKIFFCKSFATFRTDEMLYKDLVLFNPTRFVACINDFVKQHRLHNATLVLSLAQPGFFEKIIGLSMQVPQAHHVDGFKDCAYVWDYKLLSHNQKMGKTYYYLCAAARHILFQYQLVALSLSIPLMKLIPERIALLLVSEQLLGYEYENANISNHASLQNIIKFCTDSYALTDYVQNLPHDYLENNYDVLHAVGLTIAGLQMYEKH